MPLWPFGRKSAPSKRDTATTTTTGDRKVKSKSERKSRQTTLVLPSATAAAVADGSGVAAIDHSIGNIETNTNTNTNTIKSNNTASSGARRKRKRLSKRSSRGRDSGIFSAAAAVVFRHDDQQIHEQVKKTVNQESEVKDNFEREQSIAKSSGDNWALPLQQPPPTPVSRGRLSRSSSISSLSSLSLSSASASSASSLALSPQKVHPSLVVAEPTQRRTSTENVTALPRNFPPQLSPHLRPVTRERQSKTSATQSTGTLSGNNTTATASSSANLPQRSTSALSSKHDRRTRFGDSNVAVVAAATTTQLRRRLSKRDRHEARQQERQREAEIREMTAVAVPYQPISELKRPASRSDNLLSRKNSKKAKNADRLPLSSTASLPVQSPLPSTDMTADTDAHAFELGTLEVFSPRPALRISVAHHQQQFRDYHYRNYNISNSYSNIIDSHSQQYPTPHTHRQHQSHKHGQHQQHKQQQQQQHQYTDDHLYNLEDDTTSPKTKIKSARPITPSVSTQQYQKHLSNVTRSLSRRKGKRPDQITEKLKRSQHRTVDSLANELDSGALREVMERDQRRREKKRLVAAEKAQRRLARKAEQSEQHMQQSQHLQQSRQLQQQRDYHLAESQRGSPKQKLRSRRKSGSKSRSRSRKRNVIVENIDEDKENVEVWSPQFPPSASLLSPPELSPDLKLVLPPSPPPMSPARKLRGGIVAATAAAAAVAPTVPMSRKVKDAGKSVSYSYPHQQLEDLEVEAVPEAQPGHEYVPAALAMSGENNVDHVYSQVQNREPADTRLRILPVQNNSERAEDNVSPASAESNGDNPAAAPEIVVGTARAVRLSQASMSSVGKQLSVCLSPSPPPPSSPPFVPDGLKQQRTMSASSAAPQQQLDTLYDTESSEQQFSERWGSDESKVERPRDDKVVNIWNNVNITPEPTPPLPVADKIAGKGTDDVPPVPDMPMHMPHASMESVSYDLKRLQQLQQQQQKEQQERRKREQEWARKLAGRVVSDLSQGTDSAGTTSGTGSRVTSGESMTGQAAAPRRNRSLRRGGDGGGSTWRSLFRRSGSGGAARVTSGSSKMGNHARTSGGGDGIDYATASAGTTRKQGSSDAAGVDALGRTMTPSEFSFSNTSREEILLLRQSGGDSQQQQQQQQRQQGRSSQNSYQRVSGAVGSAGSVTRRRSKFREDLPELPLSPPDSRLHSPIESHETEESLAAAGFTSSRSVSGTASAAAAVVAATENMTVAAAASTPKKEAKVHRVVSLAGRGGVDGVTGELGRSGSGAISARRTGRTPADLRIASTGGGAAATATSRRDTGARTSGFGSDKDFPPTPAHKKGFSASSNNDDTNGSDAAYPMSTTSLLASPGSEGSWLTGRGTGNMKSGGEKQRSAAQQLHVQYQERLNQHQNAGDAATSHHHHHHFHHQDSARSSQELDDGNVIVNDDYFRRLALVQLPAPPPIPDDDPAYSPPSGRIPSSIVVGRAGRSRSRGGSGSSRGLSSGDGSRNGRDDGVGDVEEDEDTVKVLVTDAVGRAGAGAGDGATITTTITTTASASATSSIKKGLSPLPQVKGLDVGVNAGIAIPPNAEDSYVAKETSDKSDALGTDGGAGISTKNAYATEYDYDYYDEGTLVHETEARRPVTLTHRRDAEKIYSREVLLDRIWDEDGSRRGSAVDVARGGSRRGSAVAAVAAAAAAGSVAAAAARLAGKTDQPALDVAINDSSNKDGDESSPTYAVVRNARSVDLRNSAEYKHAKHLSAGSAKLLDIGSGGGSKRQSADSTSAVASSLQNTTKQASTANIPQNQGCSQAKDIGQGEGHGEEQDEAPRGRSLLSPASAAAFGNASIGSTGHSSSELRSSSGGDSYRFL